ncbi:MAG TPA: prephenate dehydratase [Planctomycetaceae bacterium]|nr:prephenate dehydratase [Planctomycetaceae bacterium]
MPKKKTTSKSQSAKRVPSQRQLDKLDREILALINERAQLTAERAHSKTADRGRMLASEVEKLDALVAQNNGPLKKESVRAIFREVLSGSHAVGHATRVAFLGPEFTYSHLAALESFGQSADMVAVGTIASVFEEVERGLTEFGIVPIENSTDGRITDALECLANTSAKICGNVLLHIHHCLLGAGTRKDVKRVYSKPQALSQCRNWLGKHLPDAQLIGVASTAEAAQKATREPEAAAIASQQAGVNHSLNVLAPNIEDNPENITRFAVIGAEASPRTGKDKTALVFEISHQPGALADAMGIFKRQKLNMTWIESFPMPGKRGRYLFFVEFQGHSSELRARRALASLEKKCLRLTMLGSYAQTDPID